MFGLGLICGGTAVAFLCVLAFVKHLDPVTEVLTALRMQQGKPQPVAEPQVAQVGNDSLQMVDGRMIYKDINGKTWNVLDDDAI